MSRLGDLIVEHGPFVGQGNLPARIWDALDEDGELNALRDELIEMRAKADRLDTLLSEAQPDTSHGYDARCGWCVAEGVACPHHKTGPRAADLKPCSAETWSWDHFTPEQMDGYWITCDLQGPHDEHKDEHTGLTWRSTEREPGR